MKRYIISSTSSLHPGDFVKIEEWGGLHQAQAQIDDVFDNEEEALANGYDEQTSYYKNGYRINTKEAKDSFGYNRVYFGAYKIDASKDIINSDAEYIFHNAKFTIHNMIFTCSDLKSGISKSWKIDYSPNEEYVYNILKTKIKTNINDMKKLLDTIVNTEGYVPYSLVEQAGFKIDKNY